MSACFLSGFNSRKLREQKVTAPTKKFIEVMLKALKLEQKAKKEKSRHQSSSYSSISASSEIEKSNSSSSDSEEEDKKKKNKGSWSRKIDEISRKISEICGLRGPMGWCTKCMSKNHTSDNCTQCNYCKAFVHVCNNCKIRIHHLKEGKDLSIKSFASMEPIPVGTEQQQNIASTNGPRALGVLLHVRIGSRGSAWPPRGRQSGWSGVTSGNVLEETLLPSLCCIQNPENASPDKLDVQRAVQRWIVNSLRELSWSIPVSVLCKISHVKWIITLQL
ncbi:hypothetical protein L7F22_014030 [Adiantum nelumboides]|nr:hypothetical protein [Adiantum nelumboides]